MMKVTKMGGKNMNKNLVFNLCPKCNEMTYRDTGFVVEDNVLEKKICKRCENDKSKKGK
jgi:formylmethanofuran dehydrogenase subunit E